MKEVKVTFNGGFQLLVIAGLLVIVLNLLSIFLSIKAFKIASIAMGIVQIALTLGFKAIFSADIGKMQKHLTMLNNNDSVEDQCNYYFEELNLIGQKIKKLSQKVAYYSNSQSDIIAENCKLLIDTQRDKLTQLYNRRYLENKINLLHKTGRSYVVMFCDIDHFKSINDNHGHGVGDVILKQVAQRLLKNVRPGDTVARYGGEEFLILAPEIGEADQTLMFAERIRRCIFEQEFITDTLHLAVTISIGVSIRRGADTVEALLKSADDNLYKAKNAGRNRVVFLT